MRERCVMCRAEWSEYTCRLVREEPDDWVEVTICEACWRAAERAHRARLRDRERHLLLDWHAQPAKEA